MKSTLTNYWWSHLRGEAFLAYVGSVLGVGVAVVLTGALPTLHYTPTLLFTATIVATVWLSGRGPAILAIVLSALAVDYFFLPPVGHVLSSMPAVMHVFRFTLVMSVICYLQEKYQRIAAELRQANDVLETRVKSRTLDLTEANKSLTAEIQERCCAETALKESETKLRTAVGTTESALKEKELLLRELNHRVKNNLQIISSLLSLQGNKMQNRADQDLFKDCQQRVHAIAVIHDRLYRTPNLANFDLALFFGDLVQNLLRSYAVNAGVITPKIVVDQAALGIEQLMPCALIVNELVCNALKYAFPKDRAGEVRVELRKRDSQLSLTVADDGVGCPTGEPRGNGVGQKIVRALVEQLSGKLRWANGRGTSATVTFPEIDKGNSHVNLSNHGG